MRIPHEPQIIIRQLLRYESVPSTRSLMMSRHVEQRHPLGRVDLVLLQRALAGGRVVAPDLQRDLHQYFLSCGCHFVIVTGFQSSSGRAVSSSGRACA